MGGITVLVVVVVLSILNLSECTLKLTQYNITKQERTTKLIVDHGFIYIGGSEYIIKLNEYLEELRDVKLGSVLDTDECFPKVSDCFKQKSNTPFDVSILLMNPVHSYLLVCGKVYLGLCSLYDQNLSLITDFNNTNHASFVGSKASSFAFFGRPSMQFNMSNRMLYVAMATFDRTAEQFSPYTISTRTIDEKEKSIDYLKDNSAIDSHSFVSVNANTRKKFKVEYLYGFELDGYGYYVSVQPVDMDITRTKYITRLIRFCLDDLHYNTYIELALTCNHGDVSYTLATAAHLDSAEKVLILGFGRPSFATSSRSEESYGSVVCNFSMSDVQQKFQDLQHYCSNSGLGTYPWWIYGDVRNCRSSPVFVSNQPYCGYDKGQLRKGLSGEALNGSVMSEVADVCVDEMISALVSMVQDGHPIIVIGTTDGHIIKASLKGGKCELNKPFLKYKLSDHAVEREMVKDSEQKHAYVITGNVLTKFPLDSCAVYTECSTCVSSRDPQGCGWCNDFCSKRDECIMPLVEWSHDTCKPYITTFTPSSGPTNGGTLLTIVGNNFGEQIPQVSVGSGEANCIMHDFNNTVIECRTAETSTEGNFSLSVTVSDLSGDKLTYKVEGTATTTDLKFEYKTPSLDSVFPLLGPESGGTVLTLKGQNLDVGQTVVVTVGSIKTTLMSVNKTTILCKTRPRRMLLGSGRKRAVRMDFVSLTIDRASLTSPKPFEYMTDAKIISVAPAATIHNGGTKVTVMGSNLHIVQQPKIGVILSSSSETVEGDCEQTTNLPQYGKEMYCIMPSIMELINTVDQTKPIGTNTYFIMDGIQELLNFPKSHPDLSRYIYYRNPIFYKFDGDENVLLFDIAEVVLEIKGELLNHGLRKIDYRVMIGRDQCNITMLRHDRLFCKPQTPTAVSSNEPRQAVMVHAGKFLDFSIGKLIYTTQEVEVEGAVLSTGIVVILVILVLIVLAIIILVVIMKKRRIGPFRDNFEHNFRYAAGSPDGGDLDPEGQRLLEQNRQNAYAEQGQGAMAAGASPYSLGIDEETRQSLQSQNLLIDRQYLQMGEILGAGHFGSVYKSFLTFPDEKGDQIVAVKTLHQNNPREIDVKAFLNEALIMKDFKHQNVLQLIGITLGMDDMPLVILPFMKHGDLLSYIRNEQNMPTIKDLIMFGIDIAEGMAYLSDLKFVHRDLACRNCMLDEEFRVKVADFGLSRDIYEKDYYACENKKTMLPVKWMALECLEKGKYSSKSDVWSFGICLWELMTRGVNPYPEVDNWDIVRYLKQGRRMPQPPFCPDHLYKVMRRCWLPNPKDRPTFERLAHEVKDMVTMLEQAMKQGDHSADIQTTYVNLDNCTDYHYSDELDMPGSPVLSDSSAPTSPTSPMSPFAPPISEEGEAKDTQGASGSVEAQEDSTTDEPKSAADDDHDKMKPKPPVKPKPKVTEGSTTGETEDDPQPDAVPDVEINDESGPSEKESSA